MSFLFFFLEAGLRDESGRRIRDTVDSHQELGGEEACLQASLHLSLGANLRQFVFQFKKRICCWIFLFKLYFILVTSFMLLPIKCTLLKKYKTSFDKPIPLCSWLPALFYWIQICLWQCSTSNLWLSQGEPCLIFLCLCFIYLNENSFS